VKKTQNFQDIFPPAAIYIYLLMVSALLLYAAVVLHQFFPVMYTWEELFINYEGGFIRRGLIGQILFLADRFVPISICYLVLYAGLFYAFLYISYKKLSKVFDPVVVAFLFICPVLFLLPVTDRYVFGRKDLFIEILLLCIAQVCAHCLARENTSLYKNTLLLVLLFTVGMLIHEMMIFYFPLFAVLLGVAYARQNKIVQWLCMTGILFSVSLLLFAVIFVGDTSMREAICAAWRQSYPELTCVRALRHINENLSLYSDYLLGSLPHHADRMGSFFLGAGLSVLPMVFLWKAYRPYKAIRELLSSSLLLRIAFWPALFAPFILFVNIDYGRYISITLLSYLFFLYAVLSVRPQPAAPWLGKFTEAISASPRLRYAVYFFAAAYGLCWRMLHVAEIGESYVIPGVLFHLQ
jgi:hypothetical protein